MAFEIVDGMTGTKHISSDDLAALNTATVGKASCVLDYGNDFSLTMASANAATLGTGVGMVGGKRFWNQAPVQLTVESGTQGQKRNDLVVARYSKTNEGIESIEPMVIKGTPTTGTAADPAVTTNDLKLWRVPLNGINAGTPVRLFEPVPTISALGESASVGEWRWLYGSATAADGVGYRKAGCVVEVTVDSVKETDEDWQAGTLPKEFRPPFTVWAAAVQADHWSPTNNTAYISVKKDGSVWVGCKGATYGGRVLGRVAFAV
jgi:hypothetical protein|nr:MAG TPA: hypothetical protein [Caudoviricetes sp.]